MSNMYQVSYDLKDSENTDSDWALKELIRELKDKVKATHFDRPVATTLHFLSKSERSEIYKSVTTWAGKVRAYWMVSSVPQTDSPGKYCYNEVPDKSLQTRINEILTELADEDKEK